MTAPSGIYRVEFTVIAATFLKNGANTKASFRLLVWDGHEELWKYDSLKIAKH